MALFIVSDRPLSDNPAGLFGGGEDSVRHRGRLAAKAKVKGTRPGSEIRGEVKFYESGGDGCVVEASVEGLPTGPDARQFMGFHIHEKGSCADEGNAAGEHYNPQNQPHGFHAGDLPALLNAGGIARLSVYTNRFTPESVNGRSVIIHAMPDDYHTQPSGNSGARVACGVIEKV